MKRVVGSVNLTIEEWLTLLAQVEACVNFRPLTKLNGDINDSTALTLYIGQNVTTFIEPRPLIDSNPNYLTRWEKSNKCFNKFGADGARST